MKTSKPKKTKNTLKILWEVMSKKEKWAFFGLMILGLIASFAVLIPTQVVSIIIAKLSGNTANFFGIALPNTWSYIAIIIGGGIITYVMKMLSTTYDLQIEALLKRVVCNLRSQSYKWLVTPRKNMDLKMTQGDALYRINEGPENVVDVLITLLSDIIPEILSAIIAFVYICFLDILSMPLIFGGLALMIICVLIRTKIEKKLSIKMETTKSAVSNSVANSITNLPVITLYKSMLFEQQIFDKKIEDFYKQQKKQINLRWVYWTIVRAINVLSTFVVIYLCAKRIFANTMNPGDIIIIVNYVSQIYQPVQGVGWFST